jgi:uncharacterized protein (DUF4213/DUF364 family)
MDTALLKHTIIERILEIEDVNVLNSLQHILNSSNKNIVDIASIICEKNQNEDISEVDNYTDFIKEWVKNM